MPTKPWLPSGFSFLSGYPTAVRKRKVLLAIQFMADDSGCKGAAKDAVMGGLLGSAQDWAVFADKWKECLDASPTIPYFKMNHAMRRTGPFARLTDKQRRAKVESLVAVLNDKDLRFDALHITVDTAAYAKVVPAGKGGTANPYFYTFQMFIGAACREMIDRKETERCEIFFDEHLTLGEKSKRWYPFLRTIMSDDERAVAPIEPTFKNDVDFLPLQAADMIAWIQRRGNSGESLPHQWLDSHFTNLGVSRHSMFFDDAKFSAMLEAAKRDPLEATPERIEALRGLMNGLDD